MIIKKKKKNNDQHDNDILPTAHDSSFPHAHKYPWRRGFVG